MTNTIAFNTLSYHVMDYLIAIPLWRSRCNALRAWFVGRAPYLRLAPSSEPKIWVEDTFRPPRSGQTMQKTEVRGTSFHCNSVWQVEDDNMLLPFVFFFVWEGHRLRVQACCWSAPHACVISNSEPCLMSAQPQPPVAPSLQRRTIDCFFIHQATHLT